MNIIDHIKNYSELTLFYLFQIVLPKVSHQNNSLLLINTGEIGDLVISSILLENSDIFSDYIKVQFLIKEQYLELFQDYNGKVEFIGYNYHKYKYSFFYKFKFLSKLRKEGFNICIHLTAARGILNEEITHLVGASEIIALNSFWEYLGKHLGRYFDRKYTIIIARDILNEYDKHFELMKYLGSNDSKVVFNNGITFDEKESSEYAKFEDFKEAIVIAPFSSLMNRNWKHEYFFEIIKRLRIKHKIVLLGSKNQKKKLENLYENDANIKVLAGKLKLNEIPSFIKNTKLYIGLDSGITHIALKMGIPLVAIIGGGEFGRFFPYKESEEVKFLYHSMDCFLCHWECSKDQMFCLTEITPQDVIKEINKLL